MVLQMESLQYASSLTTEFGKMVALSAVCRLKPDHFIKRYDVDRILEEISNENERDRKYPEYAAEFLRVLRDKGLKNLLELYVETSDDSLKELLWRYRVTESKYLQTLRWLKSTRFLKDYSADRLEAYYSSAKFKSYCGFLRLNNPGWLQQRCEQFELISRNRPQLCRGRYLEYGGSTGMLAIFAKLSGFEEVTNFDISREDLTFGAKVQKLVFGREIINSTADRPTGKFDVVSCHQVIEHFADPLAFLTDVMTLVDDNGLLILSTGFHVYPHPGHIPFRGDVRDLIRKAGGQIIGSSDLDSHTYYIGK